MKSLIPGRDLARVKRLRLVTRRTVDGIHAGRHRSPRHGQSNEFKEHRGYTPGDELKTVDWKALAKHDRLFVRKYEQETDLRCHLLLDLSGSMGYGGERAIVDGDGRGLTKADYARRLAAVLVHLTIEARDQMGLVVFDRRVRSTVPCRGGDRHLTPLMHAIATSDLGGETDLGRVLHEAAAQIPRRRMVLIVTDAADDPATWDQPLTLLETRGCDVVVFRVRDRDEVDFPLSGRWQFVDPEGRFADQVLDADDVRRSYLRRVADHDAALRRVLQSRRVTMVDLTTDVAVGDAVADYLGGRAA